MTGGPEPISPEGLRAVQEDLAQLRAERARAAATLRAEDPVGDRADAADELQRASDVLRLDRRIAELELRLHEAEVAGPPATDVVGVGSTVTLRFADGSRETVAVGELAEHLEQNLVTADSPLGRALLGHRAGDTVDYQTPGGGTSAVVLSIGR
ncbi:GreA/GreB family elongation factor [Kitasatospora sp. NPDC048538]|uniref:GreA/GreB family elongation factor n=1 Tax=unclassified Kitasatospora TaxID=2633591 RepID=UPI0034100128